jgi:acetyltransferase-like isoleucine patch superfamily enzyme
MKLPSLILRAFIALLPWSAKRIFLIKIWGYNLDPSARIGFSWIYPEHLSMGAHSKIGHLNVCIHINEMKLGVHSKIGRSNWITGYPKKCSKHFVHRTDRDPSLYLGSHAAITKNHHFDCTDTINIGALTTVAGYGSQFLTHSIDVHESRQDCHSIEIGTHCFVGTNVVILGGSKLPDRSVLGAKALLNKVFDTPDMLYGGVPAKALVQIEGKRKYFEREHGFVA